MTYPYQPGPPPELPPPNDPVPQGVPVQPMYYYPPPAYPYQPYQGYQPATEGLAIASLVVSCVAIAGLCAYGLGALLGPVGAILGHVARRRIATNGSGGAGLALAGIIIGWIMTAFAVLAIVGIILVFLTSQGRNA